MVGHDDSRRLVEVISGVEIISKITIQKRPDLYLFLVTSDGRAVKIFDKLSTAWVYKSLIEKDGEKMTSAETRKRHEEARKAKDQERKEIREKMTKSCLSILDDPGLTPGERLEALKILHNLTEGR